MTNHDEKIRLQLFLARCGIASRRKSADIIESGKVMVNGEIVTEPYRKIDPDKDIVELEGIRVKPSKYSFYKMYKPVGILTTLSDDRGRKTIADLIPNEYGKLFPVGRLDLDSEGLLILTNHGEAANRMVHPRYHFPKVYNVTLNRTPEKSDLIAMSKGIDLNGKKTLPGAYELMGKSDSTKVRVEIIEGRKRQIKMVFRAFNYKVVKLKRISIGPVKLGNMKPGEIRELTMQELMELLSSIDLGLFS